MIVADNQVQQAQIQAEIALKESARAGRTLLSEQKAKDDITIDWMRHRINALEKLNAQLLMKAAGIFVPVPEIVPTRPGTITDTSFDYSPDFNDVGDAEADRLGIKHADDGSLKYEK